MIGVDKVEDIRKMGRRGATVAEISRETGVSEPTVRKYLRAGDLSPEPPRAREPRSGLLGPYEATIDGWLEGDRRNWRKQRHTAARVYARLRDEEGYEGSYSTVQRYVKRRREEMAAEADAREAQGYLLLDWDPGECQVDFGEADFRVRGVTRRGHYLTVAFPHSNVGLTQVFWGETAECVCQGLRDVFERIGGVPARAVFDNATGVGRRFGDHVVTSRLFRLFAAHYGLDYSFTNPRSGNEKGCVENKVGAHRRNLFVPVPAFHDAVAYNARLLDRCLALSEGKGHYRSGRREDELFAEDAAALSPLPPAPFSCVTWETRRCDKQGTVTVGGPHRYSAGPAAAGREVNVALGAFEVSIADPRTGEVLASYEREWGSAPTDSADPALQLRLLCMRSGGWRSSSVRAGLPDELVAYLDTEEPADLRADLRALRDQCEQVGWAAAVEGMSRALAATGGLDAATVAVSAARAASGDARVDYGDEADLSVYDGALGLVGGGRR
jgi:transposase